MSRAQLAQVAGLSRRQVASFERGKTSASEPDLNALAHACGVDVGTLVPPGYNLTLVAIESPGSGELRGEAALDALLREYLSMVGELRDSSHVPPSSLRQDDLSELARVLGGSPEAIEARLVELLGADEHEAWQIRTTILPSSKTSSGSHGTQVDAPA